MTSWKDFAAAESHFASRVEALFTSYRHHTMATVRRDGSPRISGTEVEFTDGHLCLGMMAGARRADDLRRDPRVAIHSHNVEPPDDEHGEWSGEAKLSGRAEELTGDADEGAHRFRIDIDEVVLTRLGTPADHLVIEHWRPDRGLVRHERR